MTFRLSPKSEVSVHTVVLVSTLVRRRGFLPARCAGFRRCPKASVSTCTVLEFSPLSEDAGFRSCGLQCFPPSSEESGFLQCRRRDFRRCPKTLVSVLAGLPGSPPLPESMGFLPDGCKRFRHCPKTIVCSPALLAWRDDVAAETAAPNGHSDRSQYVRSDPMDYRLRPKPLPSFFSHPTDQSQLSVL